MCVQGRTYSFGLFKCCSGLLKTENVLSKCCSICIRHKNCCFSVVDLLQTKFLLLRCCSDLFKFRSDVFKFFFFGKVTALFKSMFLISSRVIWVVCGVCDVCACVGVLMCV